MTDIDVAVVGAGISGLTAAYRLQAAGRTVRVLEAAERAGGRMASRRHDGYLLDEGAETIAARGYDATWALIRATGIAPADVLPIDSGMAVWRGGRAHADMGKPAGLVTGAGMSARGRLSWLRFTASLLARHRDFDPDHSEATPLGGQTIADLARRYHGDLHDYLLQPLAAHCFGWRPERSAIAPMITNMLAVGGAGARWMTYRDGMDTLARALAERCDVTLGARVIEVKPGERDVRLALADGTEITARRAVLAVPAPLALTLHADVPPDERPYLAASTYTPMLKVACLLDRALPSPTRRPSYAVSIPASENQLLTGVILDHVKAASRAPAGRGLVSLFVSPYASPDLLEEPDERVATLACRQAEHYLPGLRAATHATFVHRWRCGLPEATPAALRLRGAFLKRPLRRVEYAGDWVMLRPSSEGAIRSGELTARRILRAGA
jgi:oxygen-dependent protoporphyrinogen oxidase